MFIRSTAATRYMLLEGLQRVVMHRYVLGAALNILANWFVIPDLRHDRMCGSECCFLRSRELSTRPVQSKHPNPLQAEETCLLFFWAFRQLLKRIGGDSGLRTT
jgi:hypothetical protein